MALTDTAPRALKPKDKPYTVADDRGLYVEVFPTGGVIWRYRYRLNGKQEKLTLGKYPALTLRNARLKRDEAAQAVALGRSPAKAKQSEKRQASAAVTVLTFGERFFKEVVSKDRKDITIPRRYFDKSIVPAIGSNGHVLRHGGRRAGHHLAQEGRRLRRGGRRTPRRAQAARLDLRSGR